MPLCAEIKLSSATDTPTPTLTNTYNPPTLTSTITLAPTITLTPTITDTPTLTFTPTNTFTPTVTTTPTLTLPAAAGAECVPPGNDRVKARVVRITDGDTIVVNIDGIEYKLRYIGMDAPEAAAAGGDGGRTGKKGSDKGIDGAINFLDDRKGGLKRALVQVKSGHVKAGDIRDLKGTLEREAAQVGIFITLEPPSRDMLTEAVTAGSYHSEIWNKDFPRLQILSIEELLNGVEVKLPPSSSGAFKKAEKLSPDHGQDSLFDKTKED